jgi:hypothetical protein
LTDLPDHTELVIAFEFVQFDNWDGETAELFVDNKLVWSEGLTTITTSDNLCGSGMVERLFPVTVTVAHHEGSAELRFTSTTNVAVNAVQLWGVKSINVLAHHPDVAVVYESNFETAADWTFSGANAAVTTCGTTNVLGGYNVLDKTDSVTLFLDDLGPHSTMTVSFDFVRIDSWESETAKVYVRFGCVGWRGGAAQLGGFPVVRTAVCVKDC